MRCRLRIAPLLRVFLGRPHAGDSAVCAAGWSGAWGCAGAVDMGVRGWGVVGGCVHTACTVCGAWRGAQAARSALLRVFLVRMHVGHSAVCAVGWCGAWSCAGAVDMGVRGWGVMGGWVHSACTVCRAWCEV